jgi:hypothetical protein
MKKNYANSRRMVSYKILERTPQNSHSSNSKQSMKNEYGLKEHKET